MTFNFIIHDEANCGHMQAKSCVELTHMYNRTTRIEESVTAPSEAPRLLLLVPGRFCFLRTACTYEGRRCELETVPSIAAA